MSLKKRRKLQAIFKYNLEPALCDELQHLKSHITECSIRSKSPLAICKWLQRQSGLQTVYPNFDILLRKFVCTPATNAYAVRYFSALKIIKDHLKIFTAIRQT